MTPKNRRRKKGLIKAYVLITTDNGCEQEISNKLRSIPEIRNTYTLHGAYDIIIDIETDDMICLKEVIQKRIRSMEKVRSTVTMIERANEN